MSTQLAGYPTPPQVRQVVGPPCCPSVSRRLEVLSMEAGTTAATTRRRFGGRVGTAVFATAIVVGLALTPAAVLAKGGSGGGAPWITLASVGGAAPTHPMLGNMVALNTVAYAGNAPNSVRASQSG